MIVRKGKFIIMSILICTVLFVISMIVVKTSISSVYAAGNQGAQIFSGTRTTEYFGKFAPTGEHAKPNTIDSNYTGIWFYPIMNNGTCEVTSSFRSDCNVISIDFSNSTEVFPYTEGETMRYTFQILNNSDSTMLKLELYLTITEDSGVKSFTLNFLKSGKIISYPGESTIDTRKFGRRILTLPDGVYSVQTIVSKGYKEGNKEMISKATTRGDLTIDTKKPIVTMTGYTSGTVIENGSRVTERVIYTVNDKNHSAIHYKTPLGNSYEITQDTTYISGTETGWYYIYASDALGNESELSSFYFDDTKPIGIISSGGKPVKGSYVADSFSYSATDAGKIAKLYFKTPVSGSYQEYLSGTIIPANSGDGWYFFYAIDESGNESEVSSVYLETAPALVEIQRNGKYVFSKQVYGAGYKITDVYVNPGDVIRITCSVISGVFSCSYPLNTDIVIDDSYTENRYSFVLTRATGLEYTFYYYIVREKPTIIIDDIVYRDGSTFYFNEDTKVNFACDKEIGYAAETGAIVTTENGLSEYFSYYSGGKLFTAAEGTEIKYSLLLNDLADNESQFTIYIDKLKPIGEWMSDGILEDGGYTNKALQFLYHEPGVTAEYSFNGGEYRNYKMNQALTEDGTYTILLTDPAGNKNTYTAHIDTIPDQGQLYADFISVESGTVTNKKIYFTWDGNMTATVNERPYVKNAVITDDGHYVFELKDIAGNITEYRITIDTLSPTDNRNRLVNDKTYIVGKWFIVDFNGRKTAFATYKSALEFACELEWKNHVTPLELLNLNDFTQVHLIASKGNPADDIRTGIYWRYKSKATEKTELYYFDPTFLNEVIEYYAKNYLTEAKYLEPGESPDYDDLDENMCENIWTSDNGVKAPCVNQFVFLGTDSCKIYAELIGGDEGRKEFQFGLAFGKQFTVTGLYLITEVDAAGNESSYEVFLDLSAGTLIVHAEIHGEGSMREIMITSDTVGGIKAYYYKTFAIRNMIDNDLWTNLKVENNGMCHYYSFGDELPVLSLGGKYDLSIYDRLGNGFSFVVYIIGNEANIVFTVNNDKTELAIEILLEQEFDTLVSLDIFRNDKKLDNVSTETLRYTFIQGGHYAVFMRDNFGRMTEKHYDFVKVLPNGVLEGVENGGRTKEVVKFTYNTERYFVNITKNGHLILGTENIMFDKDGDYIIDLIDRDDEKNIYRYTFEIDTQAPIVILDGAEESKTTNKDVEVTWNDVDVASAFFTCNEGTQTSFINGTVFSKDGSYVITITDTLGNTVTVRFGIDKILDYDILINNEHSTLVEGTNKNIVIINNEPLYITVAKDNVFIAYKFGDMLLDEGTYVFKIHDEYGNTTSFKMVIDKTVMYEANVFDGVITNDNVVITANENVTIIVIRDGKEYTYKIGKEIPDEGDYKVVIYDAFGNEAAFSFRIIKKAQSNPNYTLNAEIKIVSVTKDGTAMEIDDNVLVLPEDGTYTIICRVNGREFSFALNLDTTAPTIDLTGIKNHGKGNGVVIINNLSEEGTLEVYKNGERIEYALGSELKDYGTYEVRVKDTLGNENVYSFVLAYKINGGLIALIIIAILSVTGTATFYILKKYMIRNQKIKKNK